MSNLSQQSPVTREATWEVSAEQRAALEQLFATYMSSISAAAVVRNAVNKSQRRTQGAEAELRRQLSLSIKMLVPPGSRETVTREVEQLLSSSTVTPAPTARPPSAPAPAPRPPSAPTPATKPARGSRPTPTRSRTPGKINLRAQLEAQTKATGNATTANATTANATTSRPYPPVSADTTVVLVRSEADMNATRGIARELCKLVGVMGYPAQKIVTAVSELARNIARYAGDGRVCFRIDADARAIVIVAEDHGPGIQGLDDILAGNYRSRTGLGRGLIGVQKLASRFEIETSSAGTRVEIAFSY